MLDENGFLLPKGKARKLYQLPRLNLKPIEFLTDDELLNTPMGSVFFYDTECYVNFWFAAFKCVKTSKYVCFELSPDSELQREKLRWMFWRFCIVTFNGIGYDMPMTELALTGKSTAELKEASDFIIKYNNKPRTFEEKYKIKIGKYNIVDLMEVAPLQGSLKLYAGRIHCERMQDLPFPEDHILTREDAAILRPYCCNDLDNTELLFNYMAPEIQLRIEMGERYKLDLRSKSDAQIAEAVINSELKKVLGYYPQRPKIAEGTLLQYSPPEYIQFQNPNLQKALADICAAHFPLASDGKPMWPEGLGVYEKTKSGWAWVLKVKIAKATYKLGMGGLHSQEASVAHYASDEIELADNDVARFYPSIILNQRLFPEHLGEAFLQVYQGIVDSRDVAKEEAKKAKKAGDSAAAAKWKSIDSSIKIVINGSFGKLGNKWSAFYAPQLMLQVTITGQLTLLMLIEMLEAAGIEVVSGNTDGIVSKYPKSRRSEVRQIIALWEQITGFKTEETLYKATFSRDVNAYFALKAEGGDQSAKFFDDKMGVKTKGAYCERGSAWNSPLSTNPESQICSDAVIAYLTNGTPIEKTIRECQDFRRFLSIKNVKGGGEKGGYYLGKVVRWYFAKNEPGFIAYAQSGNKVAKTDGARPCMDLSQEFPQDIDYKRYVEEATEILFEIGRFKKAENLSLF